MAEEKAASFPFFYDLKEGDNLVIEFPEKDAEYEAYLMSGTLINGGDKPSYLKATYLDVESDAEDIDTAPFVYKTTTLAEYKPGGPQKAEITFCCVKDNEAKLTMEGPGTLKLVGVYRLAPPEEEEEEYYEEDEEETHKDD